MLKVTKFEFCCNLTINWSDSPTDGLGVQRPTNGNIAKDINMQMILDLD